MLLVVAPFDHRYDVPNVAVNVTLPPVHNAVEPDGVMVALPALKTVTTVATLVAEQPLLLVTRTV